MRLLLSKRQFQVIGLVIVIILAAWIVFIAKAEAAEKPQYFMALSALYSERLGGGAGVGIQVKDGHLFILQATYTYSGTRSGTTPFTVGCESFAVPWSTGSVGTPGLAFTWAIPISKK